MITKKIQPHPRPLSCGYLSNLAAFRGKLADKKDSEACYFGRGQYIKAVVGID